MAGSSTSVELPRLGDDLLTLTELAERCRTTEETVRHWRKVGYGPKGFRVGRRVLYDRREVEAFLDECRATNREGGVR